MPIRRREYRNRPGGCCSPWTRRRSGGRGPSVCIRRGDLLDILRAGTAVTPRWNTAVEHAEPAGDGVRVQLDSGPATETYDFVVGADGVHSSVRPRCRRAATSARR